MNNGRMRALAWLAWPLLWLARGIMWPLERLADATAARMRRIDLEILWPRLCASTNDIEKARVAFFLHAADSYAWRRLGDIEIMRVINKLEFPRERLD